MNISKFLATTSVVALVGVAGATSANAATLAAGAPYGAVTVASELFGTGAEVVGAAGTVQMVLTGASNAATKLITFTLSNATFPVALTAGDLTNNCDPDGAGAGAAVPGTTSVFSGGTAGSSTVTFRNDNSQCAAGNIFTLTEAIAPTTALRTAGTTVTVTGGLADNIGNLDGGVTGGALTLMTSVKAITRTVTANANTILVATNSTKFTGDAREALIGSIALGQVANAETADLATDFTLNLAGSVPTGTITLTGDFSAMLADPTGDCVNGVYIDLDASGTCNSTAEDADTLTASTATFNLTNAEVQTFTVAKNVRVIVDGTTQIATQTPTAVVALNYVDADFNDDTFAAANLGALTRDGSTKTIPFHLAAVDATSGYTSRVRIVNTSNVNGILRISVDPDDGAASTAVAVTAANAGSGFAGNATAFDAQGRLMAGRAVELTNAQIEAITGTTVSTTTRARVTFSGEFTSMDATPYIVQPGGVLGQLIAQ